MAFGDLLINRVLVMSECKGNGAGYSGGQVSFLFLFFTFFANVNVVENLFCTHKMCLLKNVRYLYIYIYIFKVSREAGNHVLCHMSFFIC